MLSVKMYFYSLGDALDKPQPIDPITPEISFKLNINYLVIMDLVERGQLDWFFQMSKQMMKAAIIWLKWLKKDQSPSRMKILIPKNGQQYLAL